MHVRHLQDCLNDMRRTTYAYTRTFDLGSEYPAHNPLVVYWARVLYRYPFLGNLWERHMRTAQKIVWTHVTHAKCIAFLRALCRCFPHDNHTSPCSLFVTGPPTRSHYRAPTPSFLPRHRKKLLQGIRVTFGCTMDFYVPPLMHSPLPMQAHFGAMSTFTHGNCCSLLTEFGYLCAAYVPHD